MLKAKQHVPNYFGTNRCRNGLFSWVLSAHIMSKAKQYSPKCFGADSCRNLSFSHVLSAHIIWSQPNVLLYVEQ